MRVQEGLSRNDSQHSSMATTAHLRLRFGLDNLHHRRSSGGRSSGGGGGSSGGGGSRSSSGGRLELIRQRPLGLLGRLVVVVLAAVRGGELLPLADCRLLRGTWWRWQGVSAAGDSDFNVRV